MGVKENGNMGKWESGEMGIGDMGVGGNGSRGKWEYGKQDIEKDYTVYRVFE